MTWVIQLVLCSLTVAFSLYLYMNAHNEVIEKRLLIPQAQKELREITAKNDRLQYEIDHFESPLHLMELSRKPEFSHLKTPYFKDVIQISIPSEKP